VFSEDIWEPTPQKFAVALLQPRQRKSKLPDREAEKWCLDSVMWFDPAGLSDTEPLWVQVDARLEDPARSGGLLGGSVSESGVSLSSGLANLVEILSRPPSSGQTRWILNSDRFTLAEYRRKGRS
jgi:hypothetical protein